MKKITFWLKPGGGQNGVCIIFFSGNGLYYPNDKDVFEQKILHNNQYEWWAIGHSEEIVNRVEKIIYARDIYKQYYVKGINRRIDDIDKLCILMSGLTKGYRVITCGNSAGGYIAAIVGIYLNAERVFSFGGQVTLQYLLRHKEEVGFEDSYYFVKLYEKDILRSKYYNVIPLIQSSSVPIMYFYSALNEGDKEQVEYLKISGSVNNVRIFAMKSEDHGFLMLNSCYKKILMMNEEQLTILCMKYNKKLISLRKWCLEILERKEAIKEIWRDVIRCHKSLQIIFR